MSLVNFREKMSPRPRLGYIVGSIQVRFTSKHAALIIDLAEIHLYINHGLPNLRTLLGVLVNCNLKLTMQSRAVVLRNGRRSQRGNEENYRIPFYKVVFLLLMKFTWGREKGR